LSLGCTLRRWALPSIIGLCPPPLGYSLHCWAMPTAIGLFPLSLGSTLRRWALPSVIGLCPLPLGYSLRRGALSLWHLLCQCGGLSSLSSFPEAGLVGEGSAMRYTCHRWVDGMRAGWKQSVGRTQRRNEENEPRHSSWFVFMMHYLGLPHPGSPLVFPPPPFLHRENLRRPHPSGKGRGGCSGVRVLRF